MKLGRISLRLAWRLRRWFTPRRPHILITSLPKSATTFIANTLVELTGFAKRSFAHGWPYVEQDLNLQSLVDFYNEAAVAQHHVRGTEPNLRLMRQFDVRPVVLVRNLFDAAVSLRDHFAREEMMAPFSYLTEDYRRMAPAAQLDAIIDLALPWYINFYVSWHEATRLQRIETIWVTYEEFVQDAPATIERIMAFLRLPASRDAIAAALAKVPAAKSRVNRAVAGRGVAELTDEQKERVRRYARHYPSIDFAKVGL